MTVVAGQALVDELAQRIQTRVLNGDLPMGTRLRQETLAAEFGVSRTPVREALRKLQASGLVEVQPRRGAVVRGPNAREIREAYEVRAELEGLAAELATTRVRDEELYRLRVARFRHSGATILAWRHESKDGSSPPEDAHAGWIAANDTFHLAIQEAAGNMRLRAMLTELTREHPARPDLDRAGREHEAPRGEPGPAPGLLTLDAIQRHDPHEVLNFWMVEHVRRAGELVSLASKSASGPSAPSGRPPTRSCCLQLHDHPAAVRLRSSARMPPPWSSTIQRAIARPSPVPPRARRARDRCGRSARRRAGPRPARFQGPRRRPRSSSARRSTRGAQPTRPSVRRVADGVRDQVREHLLQALAVAGRRRGRSG